MYCVLLYAPTEGKLEKDEVCLGPQLIVELYFSFFISRQFSSVGGCGVT
jgi:hypothetical protein